MKMYIMFIKERNEGGVLVALKLFYVLSQSDVYTSGFPSIAPFNGLLYPCGLYELNFNFFKKYI